jgi:hypothetical protein
VTWGGKDAIIQGQMVSHGYAVIICGFLILKEKITEGYNQKNRPFQTGFDKIFFTSEHIPGSVPSGDL